MNFDDALAESGGFGRFQLRTILLMTLARVTLPFHFLLNNFVAAVPSHHCDIATLHDDGVFKNLSLEERLTVTIPVQEDGTLSSCRMFAEPQYHLLLNSSNITGLHMVPCQNGWVYNNSIFESTIATQWDLVCDRRGLNQATATLFSVGLMLGAALFGHCSDRYGRKRMLLVSYVSTIIFGFASAFSDNFTMFAVMRFFTGVGLSGLNIISMVLCIEWVDIKRRTAVGILMSMDWGVASALLAVVAYFVTEWRHLTAILTTPLFLAMISWWWLPESARWLISNGKVRNAHFYLLKCAKLNRREKHVADIQPETLSRVLLEQNEYRKYSYLDLVRTSQMRRLALLTGAMWYGVACAYYGICLNITGFGVSIYLTQFIYGVIEIPAKLFIYCTLSKIGRKLSQIGSLVLTGTCLLCNIFIPEEMWLFRTVVAAMGKMFSDTSFIIVFLYTIELFPTVMRQNGIGYCSFMACVGQSVAPLIMLLEDVWVHLPSTIFCLVAFAAGISASLFPETQNVPLPETMKDIKETR
ncbi:solute carrier family 22 member 7-like [Genypterus blacodes]|uniref:solute carrier family 22 member 7-like n=1 Tax=Genypterus blacodes TaxID=154954 RepID=UPI003F77504D